MAIAHQHRMLREAALALARWRITLNFGHSIAIYYMDLERITASDWEIIDPGWRKHPHRTHLNIDFNWLKQRNKRRDKFDVSIWYDYKLCGIFLAKLSRKKVNLALRYLESNPEKNALSGLIIPIALIITESFAKVYNASQVMISQPNKALVSLYRNQGYKLTPADKAREDRGCQIRAKTLIKRN